MCLKKCNSFVDVIAHSLLTVQQCRSSFRSVFYQHGRYPRLRKTHQRRCVVVVVSRARNISSWKREIATFIVPKKIQEKKTQRALSHLSVGRSVCGDRAQRRGVGVVWWQCDVMKNTTSEGDGEKSDRRTWKCGEHSHIYDFYKS